MKKSNRFTLLAFVLLCTWVMAACSITKADGSQEKNNSNETDSASEPITAVGSSALQPLVEAAAQQYTAENPGAVINVQGGGSGTGLSKISEGAVDIGNSDIFAEEKEGVDASALTDHKVAVVGMGPVVHNEVGVENVSTEELIGIFTGEITNWSELGGQDQDIIVINRAQGSGTRATFEAFALQGKEPIEAQEQDSSGTVRKIVSETPGSISYLAFSYFDDSTAALKVNGVEPNQENVETNDWEIWAYQHMYTNGEAKGLAKDLIVYILSAEVQEQLLPEMDYLPVTGMKIERDAEGNITEK
ncbi:MULTISPECIES: phosphate ABC transporter substrate-binding protein PstS family protein [unclassified Sporosarcina]|uniref:phosphate ABC transporter substrate-binding protein PstS family protein n=1 Tax=unclassified Sporosarcina TaxID=2647733 RepID=UPI00203A5777|nr:MULTISPECIES: phosphate ABC transporter substrate-binding protein PstS family protein [unclassified Sporosarcina]GKV66457.1 phosphate ABC transporter substrate-binding protein [Sporosarcina sp. NCCP-2331]GLB56679.1 phosphate ABC transporter substrate-binding protein [Sporosarcina sp. NCCP-2378]